MSFLGLFYDLCFFRSRLNASQKNDVYFNFWCDFTRQRKKGHFLWFECFSNFGVYDFYRALEGLEAGNTRKWAEQLRLSVLCRGQYRSGRLARGHGPWIKCTYRSPTEGRDHSDLPYWQYEPSVKGAKLSAHTVSTRISPTLIIRLILLFVQYSSIWEVEMINFRVNTLFGVKFDAGAESEVKLRI